VQPPESAPPHPTDELIVRLVRDREAVATPTDVAVIVERIATAPFNHRPMRVRARDRGLAYGSIVIGQIADPLEFHLAKRVQQERQWIDGTTIDEYLSDLRTAVHHPYARVLLYDRAGQVCAATISPTEDIVPIHRRGRDWLPHMLVVYWAQRATIRTGYMFSGIQELNLPEAIRWLR
jgi:hypothetical protein